MTPKLLAVDGLDTLNWDIDTLGPKERLHATSADLGFNVVGTYGTKTLICPVGYYSGTPHVTKTYQLFVETTTSSTQILGPHNEDLELVIDTIGGMGPEPPDPDGDAKERQHDRHEGRD
ncbi:MAG TPA: hypothetical protein VIA62_06780 [Thermoanaerobaculia bacterium]|nr:hypothetical protein [Thermoanaerobaculia bacterium]